MFTVSVRHNLDKIGPDMRRYAKQMQFAIAKALTNTAQGARRQVMRVMPIVLDRPTPFTLRGIGYTMATKQRLSARVFVRDTQAKYLGKLIDGGMEFPKKRALLTPEGIKVNQYGNLPRNAVKRLLGRKDVFSGKVRGVPGIWQRTAKGVKLLVSYQPRRNVKRRFDFVGVVRAYVGKYFRSHLDRAIADALRTAR